MKFRIKFNKRRKRAKNLDKQSEIMNKKNTKYIIKIVNGNKISLIDRKLI